MPAKLIHEFALHWADEDHTQIRSYWPEYWPVERLLEEFKSQGTAFFSASYQNDPSALEGNVLKTSWVHYYSPEDIAAARADAGLQPGERGTIYAGIDPAGGGESRGADSCGGVAGEKLRNRLFIFSYLHKRIKIEHQAQEIENWLDTVRPDFVTVEDTASKGYVYQEFQNNINGGKGTKYMVRIEKPQGRNAVGNKQVRFLSMAPRFENSQILVPGTFNKALNTYAIHPAWNDWLDQWRSFPAGHDDLLDGTFWMQERAYRSAPAASASKEGSSGGSAPAQLPSDLLCLSSAHRAYRKPLTSCVRCLLDLGLNPDGTAPSPTSPTSSSPLTGKLTTSNSEATIGARRQRPNRMRLLR